LFAEALNGHPMGKQHQISMLRTGGCAFSILALVLTIRPPGAMAADIRPKQDQELKCGVSILRQRHADAYARYFGGKPNDIAGQNFAKWSEAAKYLGKRFYEITSEEKFDEDKLGEQSSLKRAATAAAPMILLFDSPSTPRAVSSVDVISSPNPSPELIQSVVSSLEKVWGKESSGNGRTEWRWIRKDFIAVLKHEPVSAEGPILNLNIDAK
jgi:hypothetical protein